MTALSVQHVSYNYGPKQALKDISFDLEPGQFCAVLGPNGAGKSTLFSLLTRLLIPHRGQISLAGHDMKSDARKALAKLGVVFQSPTLDLDMSVWRNLTYFAALQGISGVEAATRITGALERLGMEERKSERVRDLNGGHRRRMEIARALIHAPEVLLLDEPTVGLDTASRTAITDHVHDLTKEGLLVVWATHLVDEIRDQDRVIILHQGEVLANDPAQNISPLKPLNETFMEMTAMEEA